MSKLNLFAAIALAMASAAFSAAAPAYAHDSGSSHESHDGFGHASDHQGMDHQVLDHQGLDRNQTQNQGQNQIQNQNQNLQVKLTSLTNLNKTGNNHSILQGLKQWEMKQERTRTLGEIVKLVEELNRQVKLGQLSYQQFQALLAQGAQLQAKFLANGGTQAELNAAIQKIGGIAA